MGMRSPRAVRALALHGYSESEHHEGWELLRGVLRQLGLTKHGRTREDDDFDAAIPPTLRAPRTTRRAS